MTKTTKPKSKPQTNSRICSDVIAHIKEQEIKPKPRRYFVLGSILIGLGIGLVILVGSFLINVKFYQLSLLRPFDWLAFGVSGLLPFIFVFPWKVLILALSTVVIGVFLVRMSTGTVHLRIITVALTIVVVTLTGAIILSKLKINRRLAHVMPVSFLYDNVTKGDNWIMGCVLAIQGNYMQIRDFDGITTDVDISRSSRQQFTAELVGAQIEMMGEWNSAGKFVVANFHPAPNYNCQLAY